MKLILQGGRMTEPESSGWDWLNNIGDGFVEKEVEWILKPLFTAFKEGVIFTWHGIVHNLPDIMGYGTMLAGSLVILGAMTGRGGMLRVLAYYAGGMIVSLCILNSQ